MKVEGQILTNFGENWLGQVCGISNFEKKSVGVDSYGRN